MSATKGAAGGGVRHVEDQGEVEHVGFGGQGLVQDPVLADAIEADSVSPQVELEVALADGIGPEGGPAGDQDMRVRGVRPGGAAPVEPGLKCLVGEFAEALLMPADGDPSVGQVKVVQNEPLHVRGASSMDGGQDDDRPLRWACGDLFDGAQLIVGHRHQAGLDLGDAQPCRGISEDHAAFLREAEQSPQLRRSRCCVGGLEADPALLRDRPC